MANTVVYEPGSKLSLVVTNPAAPTSGVPCRIGSMTGLTLTKINEGGNDATHTTVDIGQFICHIPVTENQSSTVSLGDALFYTDAVGGISNDSSGYFFGIALGAVTIGATTYIDVLHCPTPGAGVLANLGIVNGKIANATIAQAKMVVGSLDATVVKTVADANIIAGIPVLYRVDVPGTTTNTVAVILTYKTRVLDVWVHNNAIGTVSDTIQVKNGSNAITDAISVNHADESVTRCATIDEAKAEIAASGTMNVVQTDGGGSDCPACTVYVLGIKV